MGDVPAKETLPEFTFNHIDIRDPESSRRPYEKYQCQAIVAAILAAPISGALKLPGLEETYEVRWGTEAIKGWKRSTDIKTGIYQENVKNGNKRLVEVNELDMWLEAHDKALSAVTASQTKTCRYGGMCTNFSEAHRKEFQHPASCAISGKPRPDRKVTLVYSQIFSTGVATAYHTSIVVEDPPRKPMELSFSMHGISVCAVEDGKLPSSHRCDGYSNTKQKDFGVTQETGKALYDALKNHFKPNTYDLLNKNCNSFSDLALYFLIQHRLPGRYRTLERLGSMMPSLIEKVTGGGYEKNPAADSFDPEDIMKELDRIPDAASSAGAKTSRCVIPSCGRCTAPGYETCCRTCLGSNGASHGPRCDAFNLK